MAWDFMNHLRMLAPVHFILVKKLMIVVCFAQRKKEKKRKTASGLDHKSCFYLPVCFTIIPRGYLPTGFAFWWLCDD